MSIPRDRTFAEIQALVSSLHAHVDSLIGLIHEEIMTETTLGVIVGGSYAYATPSKTSDLDITTVTTQDYTRRELVRVKSLVLDHWTRSLSNVEMQLKSREHVGTLEIFARGAIAIDTSGLIVQLKTAAEKRWTSGPEPASNRELVGRARRLLRLGERLDSYSGSESGLILLRAMVVNELVTLWFILRHFFPRGPSALANFIGESDPEFEQSLVLFNATAPSTVRCLIESILNKISDGQVGRLLATSDDYRRR